MREVKMYRNGEKKIFLFRTHPAASKVTGDKDCSDGLVHVEKVPAGAHDNAATSRQGSSPPFVVDACATWRTCYSYLVMLPNHAVKRKRRCGFTGLERGQVARKDEECCEEI